MSSSNSINAKKNIAQDSLYEDGINPISHVKSAGAMTISPELFEKVKSYQIVSATKIYRLTAR
jgi:hypothetical protein